MSIEIFFCKSRLDNRSTSNALSSLIHNKHTRLLTESSNMINMDICNGEFHNSLVSKYANTFAARVLHSPKIALNLSFSSTYCI